MPEQEWQILRDSQLLQVIKDKKLLSDDKIKQALEHREKLGSGKSLADTLVKLGMVKKQQISQIVAQSQSVPVLDIAAHAIDVDAMEKLPRELLEKNKLLPLVDVEDKGKILLAVARPLDFETVQEIQFMTNRLVETALAPPTQILNAIEEFYSESPHERRARQRETAHPRAKEAKPIPKSPHLAEVIAEILIERGLLTREEIAARLKTREL